MKKWSEVAQSCPTLCGPMDCSLPGSSVSGVLQAGILEWVAIPFSRRSSQPRDRTWVFRIAGRRFTIWATREVHIYVCMCIYIYVYIYIYIYKILFLYLLLLLWVFVASWGLSIVAVSGGCSSLWCAVFSLWWLLLWQSKVLGVRAY